MRSLIATIIFIMLIVASASAMAPPLPVLVIESGEAPPGENTTVNITAYYVNDLANFDITIEFNSSVVNVVKAENNPLYGTEINNLAYSSDGWVRIASLNTESGQNDNVVLSTLTLQATGNPGESSCLNLSISSILDSEEGDVFLLIQNGTFNVSSPAPRIVIEDREVKKGEETSVKVIAFNVTDLSNFDITVIFDPSVLKVADITGNPVFGTPIVNMNGLLEGWVRVASLNTGGGQNGDVLLFTLDVEAMGNEGDTSSLNLIINTLVDSSESDITVNIENGTFRVKESESQPSGGEGSYGGGGVGGLPLPATPVPSPTPTATPTTTATPAATPSETPQPTPQPQQTPQSTPLGIPEELTEPFEIIVVDEISDEKDVKEVLNGTEFVEFEYETVVQKVIVVFEFGNLTGYRVVHKVNVTETNTDSELWLILNVSKEIAQNIGSFILPENIIVIEEDPIVGVNIATEKETEGELDVTVVTEAKENDFTKGIEITHKLVLKGSEKESTGSGFLTTQTILVIAGMCSAVVIFLALRRRV